MQELTVPMSSPVTKSSTGSSSDFLPIASLIGLALLPTIIAAPFETLPINDEWAYCIPVKIALEQHKAVLIGAAANALPQIFLGSVLCAPFGYSLPLLRCISIVMGALSGIALYCLAREIGLHRREAWCFGFVLLSCPFVICLSNTFMTDVPSMFFLFCSLLFLLRALKGDETVNWFASSIFFLLDIATRQSSICILPALICLVPIQYLRKKNLLKPFMFHTALPIVTFLLLNFLLKDWILFPKVQGQYALGMVLQAQAMLNQPLKGLQVIAENLAMASSYTGLFLAPLLIALQYSFLRKKLSPLKVLPLALAALFLFASLYSLVFVQRQGMPWSPNLMQPPFLGTYFLLASYVPDMPVDWITPLTIASFIAGTLFLAAIFLASQILFSRFNRIRNGIDRRYGAQSYFGIFNLIALFCSLSFVALQITIHNLDRYFLISLPPLICILAIVWRQTCKTNCFVVVMLVALSYYVLGINQCKDSHNFAWARERSITELMKTVDGKQIDGGYEFNLLQNENLYGELDFSPYKPSEKGYSVKSRGGPEGSKLRWWPINSDEYVISCRTIPGYDVLSTNTYLSPLRLKHLPIYTLRKQQGN